VKNDLKFMTTADDVSTVEVLLEAANEEEHATWLEALEDVFGQIHRQGQERLRRATHAAEDEEEAAEASPQAELEDKRIAKNVVGSMHGTDGDALRHVNLVRKTSSQALLEQGVFDAESAKISLPAIQSGEVEIEVQMRKYGPFWHHYTLRFCSNCFLRINSAQELKDSHRFSHIKSIDVSKKNLITLVWYPHVPHGAWSMYCERLEELVQNFVYYAIQGGRRIEVTFASGVEPFPIASAEHIWDRNQQRLNTSSSQRISRVGSISRSQSSPTQPRASSHSSEVPAPIRTLKSAEELRTIPEGS